MLRTWCCLLLGLFAQAAGAGEEVRALLSLSGSNTIGQRLAPALAQAWAEQRGYRLVERQTPGFDEQLLIVAKDGVEQRIHIAAHGTGTGLAALAEGQADLWMASRAATGEEIVTTVARLGRLDDPRQENVVALDGVAVIVAAAHPLRSLSIDQLRGVFDGSIRDWAALGLRPGPIRVLARDDKSGTFDTFKSLVLTGTALSSRAERFESTEALAAAVSSDPGAIGFVGLGGVGAARALALAYPGMTAIAPGALSVATEDYPLARRLLLYSGARPSAEARDFIEFAVGPAGQAIAADIGFVSQQPGLYPLPLPAAAPPSYREFTDGALRLSINLRFGDGLSYLDSKALRDLDRIAAFLRGRPRGSGGLILLGFSDAHEGNPIQSVHMAENRADYVALELGRRGIGAYRVRGIGQALPVAPNDNARGRAKNRRVELWLKPAAGSASTAQTDLQRPGGA
ncbi:MAG: substrate-binding domain-containing protein [Lysobacterales bacterium]